MSHGRVGAWVTLPFVQLFVVTVLILLLMPLLLRFPVLEPALILLYLHAVAVSLTVAGYRRLRWPLLAGWAVMLALKLAPAADPAMATAFYVASRILVVGLLSACVAAILSHVLRAAVASVDRIFAAIVAYLLAGLGFAAVYGIVVALEPESFTLPPTATGVHDRDHLEVHLIYFSFVTIATVGYGDITPRLPLAQMLAVLEAVGGQFYVAVVIAWLVSAYAAQRRSGL